MPRRFERHRRSTWEWGTQPARSAEVQEAAAADPDPARKAPARKNTRDWCKGKVGREHVLHLVFVPDYLSCPGKVCEWGSVWSIRGQEYRLGWKCRHREECINCGRVFREHYDLKPQECPAYPGIEGQREGAVMDGPASPAPCCPQCGGKVAYDLTCRSYGGTDADGRERWWSCMPCDSAIEYLCTEWLRDVNPGDCGWRYTHGFNPANPRAAANEANRPPWIPVGLDAGHAVPGVRLLGDDGDD